MAEEKRALTEWGFLREWLARLVGARERQGATNVRINDQAIALRRSLAASFEDWPNGPQNREELVKWAFKLTRGFPTTDAMLAALLDLRAEASGAVRRAIGQARDEYYAMANLINPLIPTKLNPTIKIPWFAEPGSPDEVRLVAAERDVRKGWAHLRRCFDALNSASVVKD